MFDKLIESDTAGADFKNRSRYFTVSTIIVGILFLTAVVYSLYAAEVGLGPVNFDVAELVAPLDATEPEPEPDHPQTEANSQASDQPTRQVFMESTDVSTRIPPEVSVTKNPYRTTSADRFKDFRPGPADSDGPSRGIPNGNTGTTSGPAKPDDDDAAGAKTTPPPSVIAKKPTTTIRKSELLNGSALYLPKPGYPKTAQVLGLEGSVNVQVTIDEKGNVISARAADGHQFFRPGAEQAARGAKFNPTILNGVPVKVTGLIVYRFRRS